MRLPFGLLGMLLGGYLGSLDGPHDVSLLGLLGALLMVAGVALEPRNPALRVLAAGLSLGVASVCGITISGRDFDGLADLQGIVDLNGVRDFSSHVKTWFCLGTGYLATLAVPSQMMNQAWKPRVIYLAILAALALSTAWLPHQAESIRGEQVTATIMRVEPEERPDHTWRVRFYYSYRRNGQNHLREHVYDYENFDVGQARAFAAKHPPGAQRTASLWVQGDYLKLEE